MIELLTKIYNLLWKKKKKKLLIQGIGEHQMLYLYLKKAPVMIQGIKDQ